MKHAIIAFLAVLFPITAIPVSAQWRPVQVSSSTIDGIQENFRRASVYSNRKLDKFSNDTIYGYPDFAAGLKSNYVQLDTTFADGTAEGRLQWNSTDGTLEVGMPGGNVNLQIGQEQLVRVRNNSGVNITNGSIVYITGESGNKPTIALADADISTQCDRVLGVATEDIDDNSNGYVTSYGLVRGLNTNSYAAGDCIWLSTITGNFTNIIPSAPAIPIHIGHVITVGSGNGTILVDIDENPNQIVVSSVTVTGLLDIGWEIINTGTSCGSAATCTATCSTGKKLIGGGCTSGAPASPYLRSSYPSANNIWTCVQSAAAAPIAAYAICALIK